MDQGSTRKRSAVHNFAPTVTKFCVMWEGQALPHDTKFGNSRCEIVGRRVIFIWSLIHGSSWSGLIKVGPEVIRRKPIGVDDYSSTLYSMNRQLCQHHGSRSAPILRGLIKDTPRLIYTMMYMRYMSNVNRRYCILYFWYRCNKTYFPQKLIEAV